jgi:hypothetical protein
VIIIFPETKIFYGNGRNAAVALSRGDRRFHEIKSIANDKDYALRPGETFIFKIEETVLTAIKNHISSASSDPKFLISKANIRISTLNHGDGTGFKAGTPVYFDQTTNKLTNSVAPSGTFSCCGSYEEVYTGDCVGLCPIYRMQPRSESEGGQCGRVCWENFYCPDGSVCQRDFLAGCMEQCK